MKRINLFDGYDSSTTPTIEEIDTSSLTQFANDAAYEAQFGTPELGMIYFDTTIYLIKYFNGAWITLNDHLTLLNIGTNSHAQLDNHVLDATKHFEMLDEDSMVSNSDTKTLTQQSAKTYVDGLISGLNSFEYSESITEGDLLKIINDSGAKVAKISGTPLIQFNLGSKTGSTGSAHALAVCYDSANDKVVICFRDGNNSYRGTAVVGNISGETITFGTPVVFETGSTEYISCCFDSVNDKVLVIYRDTGAGGYGMAVVGAITGTSITFGGPVLIEFNPTMYTSCAFDPYTGYVIAAYRDATFNQGKGLVLGINGMTVGFGSSAVFHAGITYTTTTTFDIAHNKAVISFVDGSNSLSKSVIGTVSGVSITFGTPVTFLSGESGVLDSTYDSKNEKVVVVYSDYGDGQKGKARVGSVTGTSIVFGTQVEFSSVAMIYMGCTYDSDSGSVIVSYCSEGDSYKGKGVLGTVSSTSIGFGSEIEFSATSAYNTDCVYSPKAKKTFIGFRDWAGGDVPTGILSDIDGPLRFVGIAQATAASGTSNNVALISRVSNVHTAQTPGAVAYIQSDGTLGPTSTDYPAGRYISSTKLLVTKKP